MGLISKLHDAQSGGSCQHVAIGTLEEAGGIATALLSLQISHRNIIEGTTVPRLQSTIHTKVEHTITILHNGIYVIAGKSFIGLILTTYHTELVSVVSIDTITGRSPQETLTINIHLRNKRTGELFIGIKELAHLSARAHG